MSEEAFAKGFGRQVIYATHEKMSSSSDWFFAVLDNPKGFYTHVDHKKDGSAMLSVKTPYGSLHLSESQIGKVTKKDLSKCGENDSLISYSDKELEGMLEKSSKALNKAILKACCENRKDLWEGFASSSDFVKDTAEKSLKQWILKKAEKYLRKEIEMDQQKEREDRE